MALICQTDYTGRLAILSILLQRYKYSVIHKKGKRNDVADAFSLRSYPEHPTDSPDPEDLILSTTLASLTTPEEHNQATFFYAHSKQNALSQQQIICPVFSIENIGEHQSACPNFGPMYAYFAQGKVPELKQERDKLASESNQFIFLDNTLYHFYQPRSKKVSRIQPIFKQLAIPRCLREDVLRSYHDSIAGGAHLGIDRTYRAIQLKYFWPKMYQNVADYVRSCDACQRAKKNTNLPKAPLVNMPVEDTFTRLHMVGYSRTTHSFRS